FAAEEFTNRRAEHRTAVGCARIRRRAGAFELELPAAAGRVERFAERDGAAVAELAGPNAELMAAVVRRERLHAVGERVPAEDACERGRRDRLGVDAERLGHLLGICEEAR